MEFLGRGGKYLRPRLACAVWQALRKNGDETAIQPVCVAVECFHKASLIHDDIEDDDDIRYEKPTVHKSVGIPLAIDAGDWLISKGMELVAGTGFRNVARMMREISLSHRRLCEGQGDELAFCADYFKNKCEMISPRKVISIYERKTGEAFALSAGLGALAAGADEETFAAIRKFALAYGVAFQIYDDLIDGGHLLLDACKGDKNKVNARWKKSLKDCHDAIALIESRKLREALTSYLEEPLK